MEFQDFQLLASSLSALRGMGITQPTEIQRKCLPVLLDGKDLIGRACTGSGKTLAFGLPLIEFVAPAKGHVQALVLVPTRELAVQVAGVLETLGRPDNLRVVTLVGGRPMGPQERALRAGAQIVVGAPGRVLDMIRRGVLKIDQLRYLVLDEADEMLDHGFMPDVKAIISHAPSVEKRQTALFSATQPEWVAGAAKQFMYNPVTVEVSNVKLAPKIDHVVQQIPENGRFDVLRDLLDTRDGATIVFARTKHGVKKLAKQLIARGYPVDALQGNMSQNARDRVVDQFRNGAIEILVATNVAARGLDLNGVTQVVNYELPESAELLTHRVGRTGRMGNSGRAVTLIAPTDRAKWSQLQRAIAKKVVVS